MQYNSEEGQLICVLQGLLIVYYNNMCARYVLLVMIFLHSRVISGNLRCGGFDEDAPGELNSLAGDVLGGKADDECGNRNDRSLRDVVDAGESAAENPPNLAHHFRGKLLVRSALVCGV